MRRLIRSFPNEVIRRIDSRLDLLSADPRPRGVVKLRGEAVDGWRVRVGNYRILYTIDDDTRTVVVYAIAHRREAYR